MTSEDERHVLLRFGITTVRPAQRQAISALVSGQDVLVVLPTGGGKSLCYQLPAALGFAPAIVVSPLVALMKDQVDALQRRGVAAVQLTSAETPKQRQQVWQDLECGRLAIVYLSPEALIVPSTLARLAAARPRYLAIDEAHCISEWGESFRPSYLGLGAVRQALGAPPTIALTATATPRTQRDIVERLALQSPLTLLGGFDRPNLHISSKMVQSEAQRLSGLVQGARNSSGPAVFYASSRRETERFASALRRSGHRASAYHAGLPTEHRSRVQEAFQDNRVTIIVATNAFGMGVDKPDVRLVMHAAPPYTLEAYYQEAGRGGRDGGPAQCVALRMPSDLDRARRRLRESSVSAANLLRLAACLRTQTGGSREVPMSRTLLAHLTGMSADSVSSALRLLSEGTLLTSTPRSGGTFRVLATPERLNSDQTIAATDRAFVNAIIAAHGERAHSGIAQTYRELAQASTHDSPDRILARLESQQVAIWLRPTLSVRLQRRPTLDEAIDLAARHALRLSRNAWRLEQVEKFVGTSRCRRLVLLRYFGEADRPSSCGACDNCFAAP